MWLLNRILIAAFLSLGCAAQVSFTTANDGTSSLIWGETEYNYKNSNEGPLYRFYYGVGNTQVFPVGCTRSHDATTVTQNCSTGIGVSTVTTYTAIGTDTIKASMVLTNNDLTNSINRIEYTLLGLTTASYSSGNSRLTDTTADNAASIVDAASVRMFTWLETPYATNVDNAGVTHSMPHTAGGSGPYFFKNLPTVIATVAPGQSITIAMYLRFTADMSSSRFVIAPEAYTAVRTLYPMVTNWPDRRPFNSWFLGEYTQRSAANPRGYFQNSALNAVGDQAAFNAYGIAKAQTQIDGMLAASVRTQGVVFWDIEGQEFRHATTYVGDPRVFSYGYAPEMNALIDTLFAMFRNAGFRVGVTIRPQYLTYGTSLPPTCTYNADATLNEYFVDVDAAYLSKFYDCDSGGVSWSIDSNGSGSQTGYLRSSVNITAVLALLRSKITYAANRWQATIFYLDSAVWMDDDGTLDPYIIRVLQAEFPQYLIFPEQEELTTLSAGIPWTDPRNGGDPDYTSATVRWVYPHAAMWPDWTDCTGSCWSGASAAFQIGLRIGDPPIFGIWYDWSHQTEMEALWATVNSATSTMNDITVTDSVSGTVRKFRGQPKTSFTYPLVMRVYFASSSGGLAASTMYCEAGTNPSQDAFEGSNACALNLTGMTHYSVRYYDFAGSIVSNNGLYGVLQ